MTKIILNNIRKIRETQSISQDFVATNLGMTQSAYAKLENNQNKITLEKIIKISNILEVDLLHFIIEDNIFLKQLTCKNISLFINQLQNENSKLKEQLLDINNKYISILEKNDR